MLAKVTGIPYPPQIMGLFTELQRRNVFRVGIAYLIGGWLVIQVADIVLENIGAPAWVMQAILLLLLLGFAIALFFSWAFEVTPEGLKRESEVDRSQSITGVTGRKLDPPPGKPRAQSFRPANSTARRRLALFRCLPFDTRRYATPLITYYPTIKAW